MTKWQFDNAKTTTTKMTKTKTTLKHDNDKMTNCDTKNDKDKMTNRNDIWLKEIDSVFVYVSSGDSNCLYSVDL